MAAVDKVRYANEEVRLANVSIHSLQQKQPYVNTPHKGYSFHNAMSVGTQ